MGLCACLGHICMVRAFNFADASLVATFDFGRLPFAAAIGILFFGETTDIWTWIGAIVIFTSAVQVTRKEAAINAAGKADVSDPIGLTPVHLKL